MRLFTIRNALTETWAMAPMKGSMLATPIKKPKSDLKGTPRTMVNATANTTLNPKARIT